MTTTTLIVTVVIAVAGWLGQIFYLSIWGTWKITKAQADIKADITAAITNHKKEVAESLEVHQRLIGEALSAIRQKINDVELWGRDHYVGKEDFTKALDQLNASIRRIDDSLGARLIRMEAKLDTAARGPTIRE